MFQENQQVKVIRDIYDTHNDGEQFVLIPKGSIGTVLAVGADDTYDVSFQPQLGVVGTVDGTRDWYVNGADLEAI